MYSIVYKGQVIRDSLGQIGYFTGQVKGCFLVDLRQNFTLTLTNDTVCSYKPMWAVLAHAKSNERGW